SWISSSWVRRLAVHRQGRAYPVALAPPRVKRSEGQERCAATWLAGISRGSDVVAGRRTLLMRKLGITFARYKILRCSSGSRVEPPPASQPARCTKRGKTTGKTPPPTIGAMAQANAMITNVLSITTLPRRHITSLPALTSHPSEHRALGLPQDPYFASLTR